MSSEVEVRAQWIRLGDDGIIHVRTKPQAEIDLTDAKASMQAIGGLSAGKVRPALVDLSDLKSMSREARQYYAGPETAKVESAVALLIKSPLTRAIGNFFMGLNKPLTPTRLFTSEAAALEWLRSFLP